MTLSVHRSWSAETEVVGTRRVGVRDAPVMQWRELNAGDKLRSITRKWRQVRNHRAHRRIEQLNFLTGQIESVTVFDGEIKRRLNEGKRQGYIGPPRLPFINNDDDYITYYATDVGEVSLPALCRSRVGTRLVVPQERSDSAMVIDCPPDSDTDRVQFGYTIWLDALHGMLPSRIDTRRRQRGGEEAIVRRAFVNKFHRLNDGVWVPIEVAVTSYALSGPIKGRPTQVATATIDVAKSNWNMPLSESTFVLAFPKGVSVLDDLRHVTFVTGNPQREDNLNELARHAKDVLPNVVVQDDTIESRRLNWRVILLLAINGIVVLGLGWAVWRRYTSTA